MREIKFRAWNNETQKYVTVKPSNSIEANVSLDFETNYLTHWYQLILEQFTGLQDKNNVDIYEGDLITDGRFTDEVKFENGCFCWGGGVDWGMIEPRFVEIVGNIHELGNYDNTQ